MNHLMEETEEEYVTIAELLKKQNIINNSFDVFQIQGIINTNLINIVNIGKYNNIPITKILNFDLDILKLKCEMLSFTLVQDELNNDSYKMISILIFSDKNIIASLEYIFKIDEPFKNIYENIKGSFQIILNINNEQYVIKKFENYIGREESIYLLTEVILEEDVIEKIIEKTCK
jgi:hypothetical protein